MLAGLRSGVRWGFLVSAVTMLTVPVSHSEILRVKTFGDSPYATIQSAIDAAVPGQDEVYVHCGRYIENIVMRDQVSIRGEGAGCTVIDGGELGPVVQISGVGAGTVLEGFTIRNGFSDVGGGIFLEASSPTITRNVITSNAAIIEGASTGYGGGIFVSGPLTTAAPPGGSAPIITRNVISDNFAEAWGGGIEIYDDDGTVVSNNLIVGNVALEGGGGIDVFNGSPLILNNTIVRNCLDADPDIPCAQVGGGIALASSNQVDIVNNVLAWNAADDGGGVDVYQSSVDFESNNAFANQPVDYAGASPTGSNGNISADPRFADERLWLTGYQPRSDSPLVDAGSASPTATDDMRGVPRPVDGNADGNALHDIGARENEGVTRLEFAADGDLTWDPSIEPRASFNLYRGSLTALLTSQIYVQDPLTQPGARRWCGLSAPSFADSQDPGIGTPVFYLVTVADLAEGSLGFDGAAVERPKAAGNLCP